VKNGLNSTVKLDLPPQNNQAHANSKMLITNAINIFSAEFRNMLTTLLKTRW